MPVPARPPQHSPRVLAPATAAPPAPFTADSQDRDRSAVSTPPQHAPPPPPPHYAYDIPRYPPGVRSAPARPDSAAVRAPRRPVPVRPPRAATAAPLSPTTTLNADTPLVVQQMRAARAHALAPPSRAVPPQLYKRRPLAASTLRAGQGPHGRLCADGTMRGRDVDGWAPGGRDATAPRRVGTHTGTVRLSTCGLVVGAAAGGLWAVRACSGAAAAAGCLWACGGLGARAQPFCGRVCAALACRGAFYPNIPVLPTCARVSRHVRARRALWDSVGVVDARPLLVPFGASCALTPPSSSFFYFSSLRHLPASSSPKREY
ncbi:hypothetical protein C8F04DRAFT_1253079 [Mycena alexandri]|uniref:Uncharacterized protein n=1 Tax=Mycena alexandri TaxID=1745969 RepID=A0AAD6T7R0_9AGAR|nr:hypothetical protein C8F04DRAFT_1253079 [Mycena alexandri]